MSSNNILVTGGTGFFGCSLLDMIARGEFSEFQFTILSRRAENFVSEHPAYALLPNVKFLTGDVRNSFSYNGSFDFLIHAATPSVDSPDDAELYDIIVSGTNEVLKFAKRSGVKKILYISSGGVYGHGSEPFPESSRCFPVTVYGKAKLEAEKRVLDSAIPCSVMRGFAFCGKHLRRDAHFAFGNFLDDALHNREIVIKGDGTPLRSYMHSDDLAEWMMTMLFKGENGRIYNCGSDVAISIHALAEIIKETTGASSRIRVLTPQDPNTPVSSYVPDISRARTELGLQLKVDLKRAIELSVPK